MDPNSIDNDATDEAPKDPVRRRLLKGGAAAGPLVLTLRTGGGWVGSGTRCNFQNGKEVPKNKLSAACKHSLGLT
jgi:hypothetical protein